VTVSLLIGNQTLELTWNLAWSEYRSRLTCAPYVGSTKIPALERILEKQYQKPTLPYVHLSWQIRGVSVDLFLVWRGDAREVFRQWKQESRLRS
jgi:hypothetical protein